MSASPRRTIRALAFFLPLFVLLSSGRIASMDAGEQLQAATLLAVTGTLGDAGGGPATAAWVVAPNGRRYQPHDIGNVILMLPAAWLGARLSPAPDLEDARNPPALSRAGASLACAVLAAFGCAWMFALFSLHWGDRTAFVLAVLFPATTILVAYARAAWDVLGACALMCGVLYYSALALRGVAPGRSAAMLALTLALACSFRFSLAPFMVPAALAVLLTARVHLSPRAVLAAAAVFVVVLLPSLVYNEVRTGSPFRPATAADQYLYGANALNGSLTAGLFGLFLSPNRGLFVFSPVLLAIVPAIASWRRLGTEQRRLLVAYGVGAGAYVLLIARMANWGAFGWGPRYLLPVLPVIFAAAAAGLLAVWERSRAAAVLLVLLSAALTLPAAVVNWHLATTAYDAADPHAASSRQLRAGWTALLTGLRGSALAVPASSAGDPYRATTGLFPDLLLWRVARHSAAGLGAAVVLALGGGVFALTAASRVIRADG